METEASEAHARPDRRPRPRWRRWLLELGIFVGILLAVSTWQGRHLLNKGAPAPGFSLRALDGTTVDLASLHGNAVLLHFWATWCGVCRQEFSALNAVHASASENARIISIVADSEDPERIRRFVEEHGIRYPVLLASDTVLEQYRIGAYPTNYFIDKEGRIGDRTVGMSTRLGLRTRLGCASP